ncbi:DUF2288 domain-containing protein [Marinobacteraceae bacterium S3BR75-40.1]
MSEQNTPDPQDPEILNAKLNQETAVARWHELQRFYARGQVVGVSPQVDLIEVGLKLSQDDKAAFEGWLKQGLVGEVTPEQAQAWFDANAELWTLVVAPWVLVQKRNEGPDIA